MPKTLATLIPIVAAVVAVFYPPAAPFAAQILFGAAVVSFGLSSINAAALRRRAKAQFNAAQTDRLANVVGAVEPRKLIMGRARVGGSIFYKGSTGEFQKDLYIALAIAGHEIDAIEEIYLNDQLVTVDAGGLVQTAPYAFTRRLSERVLTGGPYLPTVVPGSIFAEILSGGDAQDVLTGYEIYQRDTSESAVKLTFHLGGAGQAVDPQLAAAFPADFTASDTVSGVAYIVAKLTYSETAFPTGIPAITAVVRGAKIFDPRSGLTAWTQNPALMMRHAYTHPNFGNTVPSAEEDARFIVAANAADISTVYTVGGVAQAARPLYQAAIVAPYGTPTASMFDDLAQAMAGAWAYAGGQLFIKAGVYTAPSLTLTETDLSDGGDNSAITISPHRERVQKFNVIKAKIWDGGKDFKLVDLPPLVASALVTRDGEELTQELTIPSVSYAPQALHIAGISIRDARDSLVVSARFKLTAYRLELFDVVSLTIPRYGWTAKEFIVVGREWSAAGTIDLTMKETAPQITQMDADFVASGFAKNTNLPSPWVITPVGNLTVSSGTAELLQQSDGTVVSRMRVSWPVVSNAAVIENGNIEIQYRLSDSQGAWSSSLVPGNESSVFITDVADNNFYVIRARARTSIAISDWNLQVLHKVIGKSEPPPPFDTFLVNSQPDGTRQYNFSYGVTPKPIDWQGAEIRYVPGNVASPVWDTMIRLQEVPGYYTSSPFELNIPVEGEWTFACRSRDTSGNLSTPLTQTITLAKRRSGNTLKEFSEGTAGWPGVKTGLRIAGASLEATDSTTTWDTLPTTWNAWTRWIMAPDSPNIYTAAVFDIGLVVNAQMSLAITATGSALVELRTSLDNITWTAWGNVGAAFVARFVQLRMTVTPTGPQPVPIIDKFDYSIIAELATEYVNDVDISTLTGAQRIGIGDIRVPLIKTYALIKRVNVTIQDNRAGQWTEQRIDNLPTGPRYQFKLNGVLTDPALVDFYVEGF